MRVRLIIVAFAVPLIIVLGTSFTNRADVTLKVSQPEPSVDVTPSLANTSNPDTAGSFIPVIAMNTLGLATIKPNAWDKIEFKSRRLTNNIWGAPEDEKLTSGLYLAQNNTFGWYWSRPQPKTKHGADCLKPIYPSVRCGGSPWGPSNSAYFPIKLTDIKSFQFNVAYNYTTPPTGAYNLAYDMFLSDTNQPDSSPKPNAEIMIWLHWTFPQPPNTYKGDFTDGNNTYELFSWVMSNGRQYYSFALKEQSQLNAQLTVDAGRLMANLHVNPNWYVHGVELGNEIVKGSGEIEISQFNVILNGNKL